MLRLPRPAWLAVDVVGVLVFCAVGRRSHAEGLTLAGVAETAWPFLTGTAVGWLASRAWRRPTAVVPTGVVVWLSPAVGGVALRRVGRCGRQLCGGRVDGHRAFIARVASCRRAQPAASLRGLRRRWHRRPMWG